MTEVLALLIGLGLVYVLPVAVIIAPGFIRTYWEFSRGLRARRKGYLIPIAAALAVLGPR